MKIPDLIKTQYILVKFSKIFQLRQFDSFNISLGFQVYRYKKFGSQTIKIENYYLCGFGIKKIKKEQKTSYKLSLCAFSGCIAIIKASFHISSRFSDK